MNKKTAAHSLLKHLHAGTTCNLRVITSSDSLCSFQDHNIYSTKAVLCNALGIVLASKLAGSGEGRKAASTQIFVWRAISVATANGAVVVIVLVVIFVKLDVNIMFNLLFMLFLLLLILLIVCRRKRSLFFWIGLNDLGVESSFKWSDGSPVQYTNYAYREPNDRFKQEDCVEMYRPDGIWNDDHCSKRNPYICKINGMFQRFNSSSIIVRTPITPK